MKKLVLTFGAAACLSACAGSPSDPWTATQTTAAVAAPGQPTPIAVLASKAVACEARPAPSVEIVQDGALGAVVLEAGERPIDETGETCEGAVEPIVTVLYHPASPGPAFDTVIFRELGPHATVDREHTVQIRLR